MFSKRVRRCQNACVFAASNKSKSWREKERVWEEGRVSVYVCVFNTSFGIVRRHAWLPLLRFYCFLALSLLWQHLGIMWAERPWPKTLLSHPQTPDCEKSLGGSYGSSGLLSAGRPERRSVLGVLWSHSFHSLSGFVSTHPQQHNSPLRGKEREREMKGGERHGANYTHVTESESI